MIKFSKSKIKLVIFFSKKRQNFIIIKNFLGLIIFYFFFEKVLKKKILFLGYENKKDIFLFIYLFIFNWCFLSRRERL
ncbi:MAG: hypothetical protein B6I24_03755 [Bacteroidetes bacterium 4572_128]|nr:MAG: hypothetical protein B6I24_03755 [Bacteroidetes bacterium 4572_128]